MLKFGYKKGIVIIVAYAVIASLIVLSAVVLQRAVNESNQARRNKISTQALYLAEAGVERMVYVLAYNIANNLTQPLTTSDNFIDSKPVTGLPSGFLPTGFSLDYTCTYEDTEQTIVDDMGVTSFVRHYKVRARASHSESNTQTIVNQIIQRRLTYTFQHAVFYADDLEALPGCDMILSGRIHSNNDIYLGADGSSTFTIDTEYLRSAAAIYNRRKNDGSRMSGDVSIRIKDSSPTAYADMEIGGVYLDSDHPNWTDDSQTRWAGTAQSSVHGVTSLAVPSVGSIQPDGYYADNADLKITKKIDGTWEMYSGGSSIAMEDLPEDTIIESSFKNYREGGTTVTVIDIDVSKLNSSGYFPSNGLLYVTREDASSSQPNGIRFKEASQLNGPLTIVSNDPVYIQGNYNDTSKQPAAVICDAVNILSNNWNDSNDNFGDRDAIATEVNLAFISGIVPTPSGGGNYSGGLENYPRLLEDWSGITLEIRGSFVELWESQIAKGQWVYGSPQYTAPYRDWNYDTAFNNTSNLPPFTPFAVETLRVLWWRG